MKGWGGLKKFLAEGTAYVKVQRGESGLEKKCGARRVEGRGDVSRHEATVSAGACPE